MHKLEEKNLVTSYEQNKTQFFAIDDLKKLVLREKEQLKVAEEAVSLLEQESKTSPVLVQYYKGKEALIGLMDNVIEECEGMIYSYGNGEFVTTQLGHKYIDSWISRRVAKGVPIRMILEGSDDTKSYFPRDSDELREMRLYPDTYKISGYNYIYNDTVCFFDTSESMFAVKIVNPMLASMHKGTFELMWDMLKP